MAIARRARLLLQHISHAAALAGAAAAAGHGEANASVAVALPLLLHAARRQQQPNFSTAAAASSNDAHEFDLVPGTLLSVNCTQPGGSVHAVNGPHDRLSISSAAALVVQRAGTSITATSSSNVQPVRLQVPMRFCGLDVSTQGGSVEVAGQINEAPLDIRSSGGERCAI